MSKPSQKTFVTDDEDGPVECLGMTFPNSQARRKYFLAKLSEKLKDPGFRKLEGFPIGEDEDILAMSDPPYFTACPNPFLSDFANRHGRPFDVTERYEREPLAADVSEGKNDPIYNAHGYHTKVPPRAIARYIMHYTQPGDLILDGFCGSGMTGVGAQLCANPPSDLKMEIEEEARRSKARNPEWGVRPCILSDLSPIASFISYNYNAPIDTHVFADEAKRFFEATIRELGWMYETRHTGNVKGRINFTVWSEVFLCSDCGKDVVYVTEALDRETKRVKDQFACPHCGVSVSAKRQLQKKKEQFYDQYSGATFSRNTRIPVLINYSAGRSKHEKKPDSNDIAVLKRVDGQRLTDFFPAYELPYAHMTHERVKVADYGVHRFHHFFFPRQLASLAAMWRIASSTGDRRIRNFMLFMVEQCIWGMSIQNRYSPSHFSQVNRYLSGVIYVPSQTSEVSPWYILDGKYDRLLTAAGESWSKQHSSVTSVSPCCRQTVSDNRVDYIFTDPPFGENIYYADLNQLVEAWHRVLTDAAGEAIIDQAKQKGLLEYQDLMRESFREYYRVLKPGRWMTVVFHNSHDSVWNAIQEAMSSIGFVVADVRILDKQQSSYRQVTGITAVKKDLVISAYRPSNDLEERFRILVGHEDSAWEFIRSHLRQLPIFVQKDSRVETVVERQDYLLYDRMVAFHVQRGYAVPLSTAEFHTGLRQRFPERDAMYFLPDRVSEYDRRRLDAKDVEQLQMFVSDEKTAVQWVRRQLTASPTNFRDLQPIYMREAQLAWQKHEQPVDLRLVLEQNFVEERDGTWRVPDPNKEADLEQIRNRALLKEFQGYLELKGRLKVVRTEALRAGFKECWQKSDYSGIIRIANLVPDEVIQEDPSLLMYYDNALTRQGE
jgi:16S rRNA G966 N2-methylase RsmD